MYGLNPADISEVLTVSKIWIERIETESIAVYAGILYLVIQLEGD